MKNDQKKPAQAHETNAWVDNLTGSEGFSGSVLLFGYAGKSASDPENSICLYLDASLNQKLDIRNEDILYSRKTGNGNELEGTLLWVKKDSQSAGKDSTDASSFLQGDLYNAYLSKQAAFPTVPVVSCVVTCTGIPVVCSQAQNAAAQTGVATLPPPTIVKTCFTLLPGCQVPNDTANVAAGFPTVPVVSCLVTCTGIPVVCSQAQNAAVQTGVATLPPPSLTHLCPTQVPACLPHTLHQQCTSLIPACTAAQSNTEAGFPTVPVVSCVVTCTGIPVVCSQAQDATAQTAIATLPPPTIVNTCFTLLPGCQVPNDTANAVALQARLGGPHTAIPPTAIIHSCRTLIPRECFPPIDFRTLVPITCGQPVITIIPTIPRISCAAQCTLISGVCQI